MSQIKVPYGIKVPCQIKVPYRIEVRRLIKYSVGAGRYGVRGTIYILSYWFKM
jgi:hypothetical protein